MPKFTIAFDSDTGKAEVTQTTATTVPTLKDWNGEEVKWSSMSNDAVATEDYWYRGRLGVQKGALRGQWTTAWMILSMLGNAHPEADVLCAPKVDDPAHRAVDGWSANIKYPWELGWAPKPEPKATSMTWDQWKQNFLARSPGGQPPAAPTDPTPVPIE